jgi:hypothetical protein
MNVIEANVAPARAGAKQVTSRGTILRVSDHEMWPRSRAQGASRCSARAVAPQRGCRVGDPAARLRAQASRSPNLSAQLSMAVIA